ncbi:TPA: extracellular solute-binding protein [Enterococcus faecalis]|nr:extracellular solute-binding protein [Listeria monocytogenes]EIL9237276.1 extracellular solute-binding protein [Listeria monocytogenes]
MNTRLKFILLTIFTAAIMVGCSSPKSSSKNESTTVPDEKIIVYSNSVSDGRGDFLKEKAKEKGFDLEIVDLAGNDMLNRIIAEKDAPIADVIFGMNQMMFKKVEDEGILQTYQPKWLDKVDKSLIQENKMFFPLQEQRVFMIYDSKKINVKDVPKSWETLANDNKFKNKYIVPKGLGGATSNSLIYNILMNYQDKKGDMGISKEGWSVISKFFKNGKIATEGQSEVAELANGVADYSYTWLSNVPIVEDSLGIKLGIVNPSYGVPQTVEQVGIIKKDKEKTNVKDFVDFLGSSEIQSEWAKKFGSAPVNKDSKDAINPRIKEILNSTTVQNNDYDFINENLDSWVEHIELNILGN